ncbi:hypothetical protein QYF36_012726 [Acer negundo]|nr:hypothetical protein QYF36_012726 [Acer negundo]
MRYADVLAPLKENLASSMLYAQKLAKRSVCAYAVPDEGSCIPDGGNAAPGERLSEVTVMLRTKFWNYLQAVDEKLAENVSILMNLKSAS